MDDVSEDDRHMRGHIASNLAGVGVIVGIAGGWLTGSGWLALGLTLIFFAVALAAVGVTVALLSR